VRSFAFVATPGRLDVVVSAALGVPRADAQRAVADGRVLVDGVARPKSFRLAGGERVEANLMAAGTLEPDPQPVPIRFEDEHLAVVAKPAGVVVHPTAARRTGTLVNRLLGMGLALAPSEDPDRPGIVHRLDVGTSGLMVVAKDEAASRALSGMFRRHEVERTYLALVRGRPQHDRFLVEAPLERTRARIRVTASTGREAATEILVRERFDRAALVEARPRTGRTHQIRVHLSAAGHPILGDRSYGGGGDQAKRLGLDRPFLHSWRIAFDHPVTSERIELEEPVPQDLERALARARA
jgi:23S rRNA pseudouridine1911/1915/1917 synthase